MAATESGKSTVSEISFRDVDVSESGIITAQVTRSDHVNDAVLKIELPHSFTPRADLLALTFACLAGSRYDRVAIDLAVSHSCKQVIEKFSRCELSAGQAPEHRRRTGKATALNFSGGLDSLAASGLMPGCDLISLDFGGRFSREEKFFRRFDPYTLRTNLVDLGLNRNHWSFMSIGSILMRDELQLGSHGFGEIMGGTTPTLSERQVDQRAGNLPMADYLGMSLYKPVAGLTEIGAIKLGIHKFGSLIPRAMQSVALPGEEKYLRKFHMLSAVMKADMHPYQLPNPGELYPRSSWGKSYPNDLSSLYVSKVLGNDVASIAYDGRGIPIDVQKFVDKASLTFFTRVNPHAYGGIGPDRMQILYGELAAAGIQPYERADWMELSQAMTLLRA